VLKLEGGLNTLRGEQSEESPAPDAGGAGSPG